MFIATVLATHKFNKGAAGVYDLLSDPTSCRQDVRARVHNRKRIVEGSVVNQRKKTERKYA